MRSKRYELRRLELIAELTEGRKVLDIGYAQFPNPFLDGHDVVGFDLAPSPGQVDHYVECVEGDVREIGEHLGGRSFDTVICAELIEHLEEPYDFLREVRPLVRPGGRLILSTPNPLGFPVVFCELFGLRRFFYTGEHTYYFLPRWMHRVVERCGFRVTRVQPVGLWLPAIVVPIRPAVLSYQMIYVCERVDTSVPTGTREDAACEGRQALEAR